MSRGLWERNIKVFVLLVDSDLMIYGLIAVTKPQLHCHVEKQNLLTDALFLLDGYFGQSMFAIPLITQTKAWMPSMIHILIKESVKGPSGLLLNDGTQVFGDGILVGIAFQIRLNAGVVQCVAKL